MIMIFLRLFFFLFWFCLRPVVSLFNDITGEYLVNPVELRVVRYLSRRVLALNEVKAVPVLTLAEAGWSLTGDVPPVKEVNKPCRPSYRAAGSGVVLPLGIPAAPEGSSCRCP
jgi:hypothetical protein